MANYNAPVKDGISVTIPYSGVIDTLTILKDGLYKFDLSGGNGGNVNWRCDGWGGKDCDCEVPYSNASGGAGGRSIGYKYLEKGTKLYVCVGGNGGWTGGTTFTPTIGAGGFNGGSGGRDGGDEGASGSGGATHVATVSGTLAQIGQGNINNILIVAGGGGAAYGGIDYGTDGGNGGAGGGLNGQDGFYNYPGGALNDGSNTGGTQSTGFAFGEGGMVNPSAWCAAGGGGLWGGIGGSHHFYGGGGGSGYIGGTPTIRYKGETYSPSTTTGGGTGTKCIVTMIKKGTPLMFWGDAEVEDLYYGDREIDTIFYGDRELE
ncbi:MAG: hypothetical protein HFI10_12005 [Lachnospiraceae bacterium]|jgi:hypothetical protein|nr:hypothetical protein [Lachnospiraceae bacterium]